MYRALLICNSVYPFEPVKLPRLLGPVRDGLAMWSALTDTDKGGLFSPENVEVLFECDKDEILKTANRFFQVCDPDDVLLFYYSGHGKTSRSNLHLCARDTTIELLPSSSVSGNELKSYMETSPSQNVIVILDCCHSGAFKGDPPKVSPGPLAGKGRFVVTASSASQRAADASEAGHPSPFTRALVEGLRHAEPRSVEEGTLVVEDVYNYALRTLPKDLPRPLRRVNGVGDAVIAKRPERSPQETAPRAVPHQPDPPAGPFAEWLRRRGFAGPGLAEPSLGNRLSWRMFLLAAGLVGLFTCLSWQTWSSKQAYGYYDWSPETEFFFLCCGALAALSVLACVLEWLVPRASTWAQRLRRATGVAFGALWFESVTRIGMNYEEQALLQSSIMFFCIAALLDRLHDSLFFAGALVSFAGVIVPAENLGYGDFDMNVLFQALSSTAMLVLWYFGATDRHFAGMAAVSLAPGGAAFLIHGTAPGVSLLGSSLALLSAVLGDGARPAEGSRSLVLRAARRR